MSHVTLAYTVSRLSAGFIGCTTSIASNKNRKGKGKRKACNVSNDRITSENSSQQQSQKRAHSISPLMANPKPPVSDLINYKDEDKAELLWMVFSKVSQNLQWRKVLNPDYNKLDYCTKAVQDNRELANMIQACIKKGDWGPLFEDTS